MSRRAFTLVELISTIAILALLTVTLVVTIPNFISWARETADKQTLTVLNDALNRYKTQGGDVNALTTGTPIAHVISKLQTAVTWAGKGHEFLSGGRTFVGRSIDALGEHHQYRFTRYDHFEAEAGGSSPAENPYPYGEGVGYIAVNDGNGIWMTCVSSTGYWALVVDSNPPMIFSNNQWAAGESGLSATFWACAGAADETPSGIITTVNANESDEYGNDYFNVSSLQVTGLTQLQYLYCRSQQLQTLDLTGLTQLVGVECSGCPLNSLNVSYRSNLQILSCQSSLLTSLDVSGCINLQILHCAGNQLGSINTTGCTSLPAPSTNGSTYFTIHNNPSVTVTGQWTYP